MSLLGIVASLASIPASIVVHELGHAAAAYAYGLRDIRIHIRLTEYATYASWSKLTRRQTGVVLLAGPAANLVVGVLATCLLFVTGWAGCIVWMWASTAMLVGNLIPFGESDGARLRALLRDGSAERPPV